MWKYIKSFISNTETNVKDSDTNNLKNTNLVQYELTVKWYNNFIGYTTNLLTEEVSSDVNEEKLLDKFKVLYNKLTIEPRLIDYLHRTREAMFNTNFKTGTYYIDSLVIRKGTKKNKNSGIEYLTTISKASYEISITVDKEHNWEIL